MKRLLMFFLVGLMRAIYLPMKCLPVREKLTIISRQSDTPSEDIQLLTDYLRLHHPQVECAVLCRFIQDGLAGKLAYLPCMLQQMRHMATSRVVALDGYCITACCLHHKPQTKILQMWHASAAIKRFGFQSLGRQGGRSPLVAKAMHMHENYDYILCPSPETGRIYCEAFHAEPDKLVYLGLPRLDLIWDSQEEKAAIRAAYRIPDHKEILLYVPTFRRGERVPLAELLRSIDPDRFALSIRLHPLEQPPDRDVIQAQAPQLQIILDTARSTQEWIRGCDRIITDYSALAVEAALADKPIYYYLYDMETYEESVGLNVNPRELMPGETALSAKELARLLDQPYDDRELRRFRDTYVTVDTDACTAKLGEFIYGIIKEIHS